MSRILLFIILIASATSFNLLAYADNDFTLRELNLEEYNKTLDAMHTTLEKLKNISDTYEIQLNRVQNILREATDSDMQYDLRRVIREYQTYLNELDNLKFNLDNNINALGEIARELPSHASTIRVPKDLTKIPRIPQPLPSLPTLPEALATGKLSTATGNSEVLREVVRTDQEAARLAAGEERLRRLGRQVRMEVVRERTREVEARRTQKITNSFFDELRYQEQLKEWKIKYPPQLKLTQNSASRIGGFLKTWVGAPAGFVLRELRKIAPAVAFMYEAYDATQICTNTYDNDFLPMVKKWGKAQAELAADQKKLDILKNPRSVDADMTRENFLRGIGAISVREELRIVDSLTPVSTIPSIPSYTYQQFTRDRINEISERIQNTSAAIALLNQTLKERIIFLTDICRFPHDLINKVAPALGNG